VNQASPPLTGERVDWQKTLSRVPYGAFQAADIYRREQEHLFHVVFPVPGDRSRAGR
jgi:hypothetical protein